MESEKNLVGHVGLVGLSPLNAGKWQLSNR